MNDTLIKNQTLIDLKVSSFVYKNNKVIIISYLTNYYVSQHKEVNIPFLYSDKQVINIEEEKDLYELKFKIGNYNNELIFVVGDSYGSILILDNPKIEGKELTFELNKEQIEEILQVNGKRYLSFSYVESLGMNHLNSILDISITKTQIIKENVYIGITKLLENNYQLGDYVTYETNVTDISNIISKGFKFHFNNMQEDYDATCYLKKREEKPLLMICYIWFEGNFSLGEIKEEIILDEIHIKYNFTILPVVNDEVFIVEGEGFELVFNYPLILDFTLNDNLIVKYFTGDSNLYKSIKLNPEAKDDLVCEYETQAMKCIVPKSHFERKPSGYYYTSHLNNLDERAIFYQINPVKVILPIDNEFVIKIKQEDNDYEQVIGEKGTIYFVMDYNDNELNLFNISEIEEKSLFGTKIVDESNNEYIAVCRLWKPKNDKLRLFCNSNDLKNGINYINIIKTTFEYNNKYNITIIPELEKIKVIRTNDFFPFFPFLYSDNQEIFVEKDIDNYELRFKHDMYEGEFLLELFDGYFNEMLLDKCIESINRELICTN